MTTYTTAAGYERDIPMTSDLDTEPSREDFEKVFKSCHAWIGPEFFKRDKTCPADYQHIEAHFAWLGFQAAVKQGKAVVSWLSLRIAHDCFEDFIRDYGKTPTDDPETRKRLMQSYDNALQDIRTALRPTSSGEAK